ncbi:MAG: glycoside hydrolase family 3 N-terminal domain-containing protein [Armatimonadota bacterium]
MISTHAVTAKLVTGRAVATLAALGCVLLLGGWVLSRHEQQARMSEETSPSVAANEQARPGKPTGGIQAPAGWGAVPVQPVAQAGSTAWTAPPTLPPLTLEECVTAKVRAMSLRQKLGQVMMVGIPEGWSASNPGILGDITPGAVILYKRNISSKAQLVSLIHRLQMVVARRTDVKTFIAIDHEGGRVNRLPISSFTSFPPNRTVGGRGDALTFVQGEARVMARELLAVGIYMNLAPVVDVCTNPDNPDIKDRAYGADTARVSQLGSAFIRAAGGEGLLVVAKHFPGYGPIGRNPHKGLPVVHLSAASWEKVHKPPFQAAIDAEVPGMMTGHVVYTALDASGVPASLSRTITTDLLRRKMGFRGMILTDDLEMGAITSNYDVGQAAVRAMNAGADILLVCHTQQAQQRVTQALQLALQGGKLPMRRLDEAVWRILWYKAVAGLWNPR